MANPPHCTPVIVDFYQRYLDDQDSAQFIKLVARRYTCATLERIAASGDRSGRRAAVLALGYMGDYTSNGVLGRALVDRDRGVRTIAENGIRDLWCRAGSREQRLTLRNVVRLNQSKQPSEAARLATELIHESPWIAEAWCQRGTAYYHLGEYDAAIRDCHQALEINPLPLHRVGRDGPVLPADRQPGRGPRVLPPSVAAQPEHGRSPGSGNPPATRH
ncbi:MAG: tetratricopeptide repeat protein [Planctomycetota bacterium]